MCWCYCVTEFFKICVMTLKLVLYIRRGSHWGAIHSICLFITSWVNSTLHFFSWCWDIKVTVSCQTEIWKSRLQVFAANSSVLKPCKLISSKRHCDIWNSLCNITQGKHGITQSCLQQNFRFYWNIFIHYDERHTFSSFMSPVQAQWQHTVSKSWLLA